MREVTYPIIYKQIPTQYVFMVHKDGLLQITPVTKVPRELKFESEAKAREYVEKYKVQL